jgi:hypothetical protein
MKWKVIIDNDWVRILKEFGLVYFKGMKENKEITANLLTIFDGTTTQWL